VQADRRQKAGYSTSAPQVFSPFVTLSWIYPPIYLVG